MISSCSKQRRQHKSSLLLLLYNKLLTYLQVLASRHDSGPLSRPTSTLVSNRPTLVHISSHRNRRTSPLPPDDRSSPFHPVHPPATLAMLFAPLAALAATLLSASSVAAAADWKTVHDASSSVSPPTRFLDRTNASEGPLALTAALPFCLSRSLPPSRASTSSSTARTLPESEESCVSFPLADPTPKGQDASRSLTVQSISPSLRPERP